MKFYEVTIKANRLDESGLWRKGRETYIVETFSCTDAEASAMKELIGLGTGDELRTIAIKETAISEVFFADCGDEGLHRWYLAKLALVTIDEERGKEKKVSVQMLVQGTSLENAKVRLDKYMNEHTSDYEMLSIGESKVLEVFVYRKAA